MLTLFYHVSFVVKLIVIDLYVQTHV